MLIGACGSDTKNAASSTDAAVTSGTAALATQPPSTTAPAPATTEVATIDSSTEWSAGTKVSAAASGTATFDGKHGTIDVDMLPDALRPNPAVGPVHVTGTFASPS